MKRLLSRARLAAGAASPTRPASSASARRLRRRLQCELEPAIDEPGLRAAARALIEAGGKTDGARGETMAAWLAADSDRDAMLPAYRAVFFTGQGQLRKTLATKAAIKRLPGIEDILTAEAERLECARGVALVELTRGAAAARARHHPPLCRRQAASRRARLRRPDRRHAPPAGERRERRLGALQARRRHRPRAGRRGAGHQPRPVGGDPPPHRGVLRRRKRGRPRAHDLRGRRHQAVDLRLPARRSGEALRDARLVRGQDPGCAQGLRAGQPHRLLPLDACRARRGRLGVRRGSGRQRPCPCRAR